MRSVICAVVFLTSILTAKAQTERRDSLYAQLVGAKEDTARVLLLLELANTYETNRPDSAIHYLNAAQKLSDQLGYKRGLYQYHARIAIVFFTKGSYSLALQHIDDAHALAKELNASNYIIQSLANTGIIYQYLGQFDKQLEYSLLAMELMEKEDQQEKLSAMYHNIANAYFNLLQYRRSIDYCLMSLRSNNRTKANSYPNRVYASLGQSYAMLKNTDSALYYYDIALKESEKVMDDYAIAGIYGFMADSYAQRQDFKEMLKVSEQSLLISRDLQSDQMLASALCNSAYAHYFNGEIIEAKEKISEALEIATRDSLWDELKSIYNVLSYIAAKEDDFKTSLSAIGKRDSIQEVIINEKVLETTAELEAKYETEKKSRQIQLQDARLQKGTLLNGIYMGSTLVVIFLFALFYRAFKQKQRIQQQRIVELETERQLMATEAVLKGEEQERTRLAKDLHDGLGGMLSGIKYSFTTIKGNLVMTPENHLAFERGMDMLDTSIKEMRRVAHNMMPEPLVRFGLDTALRDYCNDVNQSGALKISYQSIGMDNTSLGQTIAITIYRIIQELINNTLKHAMARMAIVQLTRSDQRITVTIEDDGKGFDTRILGQSKGIGWTNIQHRVDFLKGKIDLDSEPGRGTSVHIEFNT